MEQFIGCDAHKKFSVFVAVNEKGQAGEALTRCARSDAYLRVSESPCGALGDRRGGESELQL
jgi:hypothetical protein